MFNNDCNVVSRYQNTIGYEKQCDCISRCSHKNCKEKQGTKNTLWLSWGVFQNPLGLISPDVDSPGLYLGYLVESECSNPAKLHLDSEGEYKVYGV